MIIVKEKEAAIQNKQQSQESIINKIITLIAKENLTIEEANKVLYETSKKINQQIVREFL